MSALGRLGLPPNASARDVRDAYLERARVLHPDRGGDPVAFARLVADRDAAMAEVARRRCDACRGTGQTRVAHPGSFTSTVATCGRCGGSGRA